MDKEEFVDAGMRLYDVSVFKFFIFHSYLIYNILIKVPELARKESDPEVW